MKALLLAARPRTLIAGIAPVLVGASFVETLVLSKFLLTCLYALFLQIGTNYANDYYDFRNGCDTPLRKGPPRATALGLISNVAMKKATFIALGCAFFSILPLIYASPLLLAGALLSLCLAILYTGGPKPLAYLGLGELFVFPFFGPVSTLGTYYLQTGTLAFAPLLASLTPAFLSTALLVVNNLRDHEEDSKTGKKTLVVRFGYRFGRIEYTLCLIGAVLPLLFLDRPLALLPFLALPRLIQNPSLQGTAALLILYTLTFCIV
jgi:1,4-dihydroxy-2-naphthoate octaprenyltransferase